MLKTHAAQLCWLTGCACVFSRFRLWLWALRHGRFCSCGSCHSSRHRPGWEFTARSLQPVLDVTPVLLSSSLKISSPCSSLCRQRPLPLGGLCYRVVVRDSSANGSHLQTCAVGCHALLWPHAVVACSMRTHPKPCEDFGMLARACMFVVFVVAWQPSEVSGFGSASSRVWGGGRDRVFFACM